MDFVLALMENGDVYEYSPDGGEGKRMLSGAADIDACGQSRYAVMPEGSLYAWGGNGKEGRLGIPGAEWAEAPVQVQAENVKLVRSGLTNAGCIDQEGNLYVIDSAGERLLKASPDGQLQWQVKASDTGFEKAVRICTDESGNVYVQDRSVLSGIHLESESIVQ